MPGNFSTKTASHTRPMLLLLLALTQSACDALFVQGNDGQASVRQSEAVVAQPYTDPALAYFRWLQAADTTQLQSERAYLDGRVEDAPTDVVAAVQLAMLHRVSDNSDPAQVLTLLEQAMREAPERNASVVQDYLSVAELWRDVLRRQHSLQQRLQQQTQNNASLEAERLRLRQQVDDLEQQIEALKAIEQQLNLREQLQVTP